MIKTITLTGTEQEVAIDSSTYCWVQNLGGANLLISLSSGIVDGADNVLTIPSGGASYVRDDKGVKKLYILGTGKAQVYGTNNAFCPFKSAPKGGDEIISEGGTITAATVDYPIIDLNLYGKSVQDENPTHEAPAEIVSVGDDGNFKVTTCGKNLYENIIHVGYQSTINGITFTVNKDGTITANGTSTDSVIFLLKCTEVMDRFVGKDIIFNGCPKGGGTWDTYYMQTYLSDYTGGLYDRGDGVLITNWEADRTIIRIYIGPNATVNNLIFKPMIRLADITDDTYEPYMGSTAEITTGLPLCSVGDVRDELVYNADGTGEIIKRTAKLDSYNGEVITTDYISSTGGLNTGATVIYVLAEPQKIALSAAEVAELMQLQTYNGVTNIFNDGGAEMSVKVATNPLLSEFVKPVIDRLITRIENLEAATLSMGGNV